MEKSRLYKYFENNDKRLIHKWSHYFDIYERYFKKYVGKEVVMLEIGVSQGGSMQMWKEYFGPKAKIIGVDIEPKCKKLEEDQIEIHIGSQSDREFLRDLKTKIPKVDILLDDGGHTMEQQIVTFEELFDHIKDDGIYMCEDLQTSYWESHGGGYKKEGTFIEYSKNFVDALNAFQSRDDELTEDEFTRSVNSLHYYDSILVIEKALREKPVPLQSGKVSFGEHKAGDFGAHVKKNNPSIIDKIKNKLKN